MGEKQGIEQLLKVVDVMVEAGNVAEKIFEEKAGPIAKATHLLKMSDELIGLAGLDVAKLKAQFKDLDGAEKEELLAHAKQKFDLENDALEAKIESGLDLALEAVQMIGKIVAFVKPAPVAAV
jgi:hypothetical protein